MTVASYRLTAAPNGAREFHVAPASAPLPALNIAFMVPIAIFGLAVLFEGYIVALIILLIPGLFGWWVWSKNSKLRTPMQFTAGPAGITVNGGTIPADRLHRLILRNHVTEQEIMPEIVPQSTAIIGTPGAVLHASIGRGLVNMGASAGRDWHQKRAKVSWRVDAEAGGRATTLGCGLDETTAYGLLQEANARLRASAA